MKEPESNYVKESEIDLDYQKDRIICKARGTTIEDYHLYKQYKKKAMAEDIIGRMLISLSGLIFLVIIAASMA